MKSPIFVYGTLCHPQVVQILLGRTLMSRFPAARLVGHARYPVRNCVFPGTIPTTLDTCTAAAALPPDQQFVEGYLLEDLTPLERKLLDWFEGDDYDRRLVSVEREEQQPADTTIATTTILAEVYLWKEHLLGELELDREWSLETFSKDHLESFLKNTVRPCREEMERLGMTKEEE